MKKTVMSKKDVALRAIVGFIEDLNVENAHFKIETDDSGNPKTFIISTDTIDGEDDSSDEDEDDVWVEHLHCDECEHSRKEDHNDNGEDDSSDKDNDSEYKRLYADAIDATILLYKNLNNLIEEKLRFENNLKILGTPKFTYILNKIRESSKTHSATIILDSLFDIAKDESNKDKDKDNDKNTKSTKTKQK